MSATKLGTTYFDKPWGRVSLPSLFPDGGGRRIGEIWFEGSADEEAPLLVKYMFTSERLSIQVHPDDAQGRARGLPGGKTECWYILDAEPDARLGIGTVEPLDSAQLRQAALDGSIEALVDWKPVRPGDFFYVPAGTVHTIGAGISLVEVQQNVDVTYRLYDWGRPRELHLDDAVAVSRAAPYVRPVPNLSAVRDAVLLDLSEAPFAVSLHSFEPGETGNIGSAGQSWFIPLAGAGTLDGQSWSAGECWLLDGPSELSCTESARSLIATCG